MTSTSAIVVCYRTPAELAAAVASLRAQTDPPDEIIVVDNGAGDGTPLAPGPDLSAVTVMPSPTNLGYGAGCNAGVAGASGDVLLLLNADVVLSARAMELLLRRLNGDARTGAVGPRILQGDSLQPSARAFPTPWTGVLGRRSALTRMLARIGFSPAELRRSYGSGGAVDWVSGACIMLRRDAFRAVDGFDERYWMYWEDADLCRRLKDGGWRIYYEPQSVVHHATAASGVSAQTIRAFHESAIRFADRYIARSDLQRRVIRGVLRARCKVALWTYGRASRSA